MKRRHHYVPQFYLRAFASAPRRIHVLNVAKGQCHGDVGLRDQCYKHRFHGRTDELEDELASFEGKVAPVVAGIVASSSLPERKSDAHLALLSFLAVQLLRTESAATRVRESTGMMADEAFDSDPPPGFVLDQKAALRVSLGGYKFAVKALQDLNAHLVIAGSGEFVTSDNPVFRYNQFCEPTHGMGVTGNAASGLQVFLPLSPRILLLLYDSAVYKVGQAGRSATSLAAGSDVDTLNLIQLVSAGANVYFSQKSTLMSLQNSIPAAQRHKAASGPRLITAHAKDNPSSTLLHQFDQMPCLKLSLSQMRLRRNAKRVAVSQRASMYRYPLARLFPEDYEHAAPAGSRVFETRPGASPRRPKV